MKIKTTRKLLWLSSGTIFVVLLALPVLVLKAHSVAEPMTKEEISKQHILPFTEQKQDGGQAERPLVDSYKELWELNIVNKPDPEPQQIVKPVETKPKPRKVPLDTLIDVLAVWPMGERAEVDLVLKKNPGTVINTSVGERLEEITEFVTILKRVETYRIVFDYGGEEVEVSVPLGPKMPAMSGSPSVAADAVFRPEENPRAGRGGRQRTPRGDSPPAQEAPAQTRFDEDAQTWHISQMDAEGISENYEEMLQQASFAPATNPETGQVEGMTVRSLPSDPVISQFGFEVNDVIRKIDGQPILSREAAINYIRSQKGKRRFTIEYERNGRVMKTSFQTY